MEGDFDRGELAGKRIIIGSTAIELRDQIAVPLHRVLPGPVVQALAYESAQVGRMTQLSRIENAVLSMLIGALFILYMNNLKAGSRKWAVLAALVLLYIVALVSRKSYGLLLDVSPSLIFFPAAYVIGLVSQLDLQTVAWLAQRVLARSGQARLEAIKEHAAEGILVLNTSGRVMSANEACCAILNCPEDRLIGRSLDDYFPGLSIVESRLSAPNRDHTSARLDLSGRRDDGNMFYADVSVKKLDACADGIEEEVMVFVRDISELKAQRDALEFNSTHDVLTRLPNKEGFIRRIDADIEVADASRAKTLLVIRLGSMEDVARELGDSSADDLIKQAVNKIVGRCREHAEVMCFARISGDQFAAWIAGDRNIGRECADALLRCFSDPFELSGYQIGLKVTMGLAVYPDHGGNAADILQNAIAASHAATLSKLDVAICGEEGDALVLPRLVMASQLREAIRKDELELHYQPKLNLREGKVISVEALVRWRQRDIGFIPPDQFIAVAEGEGVIRMLTAWVLKTTVAQIRQWIRAGIDVRIAVNISSRLLEGDVLNELLNEVEDIDKALVSELILEITENAVMENRENALRVLADVSRRGYRLSLDDFGTGQSSFAYLKDIPVKELKIDRSFVMDMVNNPKDARIVASIINLGHSLGLEVVAEGVELDAAVGLLKEQGCDYVQGYVISKPLPADELEAWLKGYAATDTSLPDRGYAASGVPR